MSRWKKRTLIAVVALLVTIAVATPTALLIKERQVDTREVVIQSFVINYGTKGTLTAIQKVKDIYIIKWEDSETIYTTLYIDGLWVELGAIAKQGIKP